MTARLKILAADFALLAASLVFCLAVLETLVFGMILKPDDVLANVSINGVVRYQPNTKAVFRHPDGRETLVTSNAHGWNSPLPTYTIAKTPGRLRIAVVGDSYVHGAFVNVQDGYPEIIKSQIAKSGRDVEVFRFGMDGAPLSQYLHMLRHEVVKYDPDIVIVGLIHNDFDEIYRNLKTRYASSFMKVERDAKGRTIEVMPADFEAGTADWLRSSATFRYLYYETNLHVRLKGLTSRLFWGGDADYAPEHIQSGVDIRNIADHQSNRFFADYVLAEIQKLSEARAFKVLVTMDGVREAVYDDMSPSLYEVGRLNEIARDITTERAIPFLDLQDVFAADFKAQGERFEFSYDWHWNERGNRVVGAAIADRLLQDPAFLRLQRLGVTQPQAALQPQRAEPTLPRPNL